MSLPLLQTTLGQLALTVPLVDVRLAPFGDSVVVEWSSIPTAPDIAALDAAIHAFVGGATSKAPIEINSFAVATSTSSTPVTKIDVTTPLLDAGTYQVIWCTSLRMQAVVANTGIEGKIRITRSDGVFVEQDDAWDLASRHAFNGAITFTVLAGQTIRAFLTFSRLGASGTAEMSGARVTIDQLSAA
jgi:hypothetical protein